MPFGTIVSLGLTGLFALFVVVGIIVGGIRGAKKAGLRLGTIIITLVLALLLTGVIAKALTNFDISFLHLRANGQTAKTVTEFVELTLKQMLSSYDVDVASLSSLAIAVSLVAVNTVVFPVLFVVLRFVLLPLYWILAKVLFGKNRKTKKREVVKESKEGKEPEVEVVEEEVRNNKHALGGALIGAVSGILVSAAVFSPVVGYMTTINIVENATKDSSGNGIVTTVAGKTYTDIRDGYLSSPYYYISKYTGIQWISGTLFDSVAVANINGQKIKINSEVKTLATAYKEVQDIVKEIGLDRGEANLQNITQAQFNRYLNSAQKLINLLYQSKLVVSVGDVAMPIAVAYLDGVDASRFSGDEYTQQLIETSIDVAKEYSFNDARQVMNGMLNVAKILNNHNVLLPLIQGKVTNITEITNKVDRQFADQVMTELFNIDLVSKVAVEGTKMAVNYLTKMLDIEYQEPTGMTKESVKTALTDIVTSLADAISGVNQNKWMYYNEDSVYKIGELLDAVKDSGIITSENYQSVIAKMEEKLNTAIDNINIGAEIKNDLKLAVDKLSEVDNWADEFLALQNVVKEVDLAISADGTEISNIEDFDFTHLGKALDKLSDTTLFNQTIGGVQYTRKLVNDAIDWLKTDQLGDMADKLSGTIAKVQQNVLTISSWEEALGGAGDLFVSIKNMAGTDDIISEFRDGTLATDLGKALDDAEVTPLFANGAIKTLMKEALALLEEKIVSGDSTATDTAISNLLTNIKTNIDGASSIDWEDSLGKLKGLFVVAQDLTSSESIVDEFKNPDSTLATDLGDALDKAMTTPLLPLSTVKTFVKDMLDIVEDSVATTGTATIINAAITKMKTNINGASTIVWKNEFGDFKDLFGCDLDEFDVDDMTDLTGTIDIIIARNHVIIKNNVINAMLDSVIGDAIDSVSTPEYATILNNIKDRVSTLTGPVYTREITAVKKLKDLLNDTTTGHDIANIDFANNTQLTYFGGKFDEIRESVLVGPVGYEIIDIELDEYVDDKGPTYEYYDVLLEVQSNYEDLENGWTTNTTFYTDLFTAFGDVAGDMSVEVDEDNIITSASNIESLLANKQANILIKWNGAGKMAEIAMGKIKDIITDKRNQAQADMPASEEKTQVLDLLNQAQTYANDYITYLGTINSNQPYTSNTETIRSGIRVNKPFSYVASIIKQAADIIDNYS